MGEITTKHEKQMKEIFKNREKNIERDIVQQKINYGNQVVDEFNHRFPEIVKNDEAFVEAIETIDKRISNGERNEEELYLDVGRRINEKYFGDQGVETSLEDHELSESFKEIAEKRNVVKGG